MIVLTAMYVNLNAQMMRFIWAQRFTKLTPTNAPNALAILTSRNVNKSVLFHAFHSTQNGAKAERIWWPNSCGYKRKNRNKLETVIGRSPQQNDVYLAGKYLRQSSQSANGWRCVERNILRYGNFDVWSNHDHARNSQQRQSSVVR